MASTKTAATFFFLLSFACFLSLPISAAAASNISAIFAFGDSTLDPGNNDHLPTLFRCNHLPYGRDLPQHVPTGRFSNGKLTIDFLAQTLGLKDQLPAYLDPRLTDRDLLTGVSFASGGSGLDHQTVAMIRVLDMASQLQMFGEALQKIRRNVGDEKAKNIVENALFVVSVGTNDMLDNAYWFPARVMQYTLSGYQDLLLSDLLDFIEVIEEVCFVAWGWVAESLFLKLTEGLYKIPQLDLTFLKLYKAGARKIMVAGLPPIGCLPVQVTMNSILPGPQWLRRVCNDHQNKDSESYNAKLQHQIPKIESKLAGAKIAYFDVYNPMMDMINNPTKYGFTQALQGCCGTGLLEVGPLCSGLELTCLDASKYLFWDSMHPTQAGYKVLADYGQATAIPYLIN